ncbi:hypothetical protein, partial [Alistipes putredinis]|uniref:hypothetical protein n=1 Tax=Alistipes putredinis TaxID=28117 RepID=UPI001ED9D5F4
NELDNVENLIYRNRLKDLIDEIKKNEEFEGMQITKEGHERIQQSSRYIISILIFEIIEQLKVNGRKQVKPDDVDKALDKIL